MEKEKEKPVRLPENVLRAFSKLVLRQCTMCGGFLTDEEYKQFEGVCKKHWDY